MNPTTPTCLNHLVRRHKFNCPFHSGMAGGIFNESVSRPCHFITFCGAKILPYKVHMETHWLWIRSKSSGNEIEVINMLLFM